MSLAEQQASVARLTRRKTPTTSPSAQHLGHGQWTGDVAIAQRYQTQEPARFYHDGFLFPLAFDEQVSQVFCGSRGSGGEWKMESNSSFVDVFAKHNKNSVASGSMIKEHLLPKTETLLTVYEAVAVEKNLSTRSGLSSYAEIQTNPHLWEE